MVQRTAVALAAQRWRLGEALGARSVRHDRARGALYRARGGEGASGGAARACGRLVRRRTAAVDEVTT